jgi:predicted DNA-binding transcriptional regulator AlpA
MNKPESIQESKLLKKRQIAARYSISIRTINDLMQKRVLPYYRLGPRIIRFDPLKCDIAWSYYEHRSIYELQIQRELERRGIAVSDPPMMQPELYLSQ